MGFAEKQIVGIRNSLKLSQRDFAREIGFSQSYVTDVETARTKPSRRFLEAVNSRFGISIDKILVGLVEKVVNAGRYISGHGFVYLFDFIGKNLLMAEEEILDSLYENPPVVIDAAQKNINQIYSFLTGKKGTTQKLIHEFRSDLKFQLFIIKNISLSKINRKAYFLLDFYHEIKKSGNLIVIDKPGLLEENYNILSSTVYPIYVGDYFEELMFIHKEKPAP